jgi:hypothetical protein
MNAGITPVRMPMFSSSVRISSLVTATAFVWGIDTMTSPDGLDPAAATARYTVRFESRWSRSTHPIDFPSDAHFSRLIGGNHNASAVFWREGQLASPGIRAMAERGRTTPLDTEILAAMGVGAAEAVFTGPDLDQSPGTATMEVSASQQFPLLTLVTMVAPSPDWFVGVAGFPLFENGAWITERRVDLQAWDAGTDSGATFTSPDVVTTPFVPVFRILTAPLAPNGVTSPLASYTFTRIQ